MVERRGQTGLYGRETGRRAHFQVGLFDTLLVDLSIPRVTGQSIGENSVLVGDGPGRAAASWRNLTGNQTILSSHTPKYGM